MAVHAQYQCGGCDTPYPCADDSLTATSCWEGCMGDPEWRKANGETCWSRFKSCCQGPSKFKCGGCDAPYRCVDDSLTAKSCWEDCMQPVNNNVNVSCNVRIKNCCQGPLFSGQ
ncbi:hypothetical protein DdX_08886 [Ditylenchus destructor]|uniref:Uncharacterized protein n=1 Tax=Ditylenchus destructor TaxID=166010 RepID=A0AAD4N568_9BILA|nr:hypothetical protein DdX_08886 [Ditylenchus destructor]